MKFKKAVLSVALMAMMMLGGVFVLSADGLDDPDTGGGSAPYTPQGPTNCYGCHT